MVPSIPFLFMSHLPTYTVTTLFDSLPSFSSPLPPTPSTPIPFHAGSMFQKWQHFGQWGVVRRKHPFRATRHGRTQESMKCKERRRVKMTRLRSTDDPTIGEVLGLSRRGDITGTRHSSEYHLIQFLYKPNIIWDNVLILWLICYWQTILFVRPRGGYRLLFHLYWSRPEA